MEMEKTENNQTLSASLCTSGCGFFGSQKFDGMCSQCYKDAVKRQQTPDGLCGRSTAPPSSSAVASTTTSSAQSVETGTTTVKPINTSSNPTTADSIDSSKLLRSESASTDNTSAEEGAAAAPATAKQEADAATESPASPAPSEPEKKSKKRNRCGTCNKKVGLTGFECRCGGLYCGLHRYSDKHNCQYDYKKEGEEAIRKNNPLIVGAKVQRI